MKEAFLDVVVLNPAAIYKYSVQLAERNPADSFRLSCTTLDSPMFVQERTYLEFLPDFDDYGKELSGYILESKLSLDARFERSSNAGFFSLTQIKKLTSFLQEKNVSAQIQDDEQEWYLFLDASNKVNGSLYLGYKTRENMQDHYSRWARKGSRMTTSVIVDKAEYGFPNDPYSLAAASRFDNQDIFFSLNNEEEFIQVLEGYAHLYRQVIYSLHESQNLEIPRQTIFLSAS